MSQSQTLSLGGLPADKAELHRDTVLPAGEAGIYLARLHDILQNHLPAGEIRIYEAGGGASSYLPASLLRRSRVTVVDIDPIQLSNNYYAETRIHGDVQTHRLPPESVDLVASYNVIEHLDDVASTLECFAHAVRPGGLIVLGAPNAYSLSGVVTKYSPHWFHVWYYRYVRGMKNAGEPGQPPFPTVYDPLIVPARLKAFMEKRGFEAVYEQLYEHVSYADMRARRKWLAFVVDGVTNLMNAALSNRVNVRHGDFHLVLRKRMA